MKDKLFALSTFGLGLISLTALSVIPSSEAATSIDYEILEYISSGASAGELGPTLGGDLQDYATITNIYMSLAESYAEDACDEAEAAEAARQAGDYESFEEHLAASQEAAANATYSAEKAQEFADAARAIADAAAAGSASTSSGLQIEPGLWTEIGPGISYDFVDAPSIFDLAPTWDPEDLTGYYIDPTLGMEYLPESWDYDMYVQPDYWADSTIFMEEFYGMDRTDAYYLEALDFYENILVGDDLYEFQNNAGYHDFLINSYVNTYVETPAYQSVVVETYTQGYLSYEAYASNIAGQVTGFDYSVADALTNTYWESGSVMAESYFGMGITDAAYLDAVSFYETNLSSTDLAEFQSNEAYHNYLVNAYMSSATESLSFEQELIQGIDTGVASYSSFDLNFAETSLFETSTASVKVQSINTQMFNTLFNF